MTTHHDDEAVPGRVDLALWRRTLSHVTPYRRPLIELCLAGLIVAAGDVLLPRITGAVVDTASAHRTGSLWLYAALYVGTVLVMASTVYLFIVRAGTAVTGVA